MLQTISHTPIVYEELSQLNKEKYLACLRLFLSYMIEMVGESSITLLDGTINSDNLSGLSK
jgi:hypothetical protein